MVLNGSQTVSRAEEREVKVNYILNAILASSFDVSTGDRLTSWTRVQPFASVALICRRATHKLDVSSAVLAIVSVSDMLKDWGAAHCLDTGKAVLISSNIN